MSKYNLILVPEGAPIPEDLRPHLVEGDDIFQKIVNSTGLKIASVNTRELQLIVEYRDLVDLEVRAVIGLQGAMYSTVWNTYVSTMDRVTIDNLRVTFKEQNDASSKAGSAAVVSPTRAQRLARFETRVASPAQDQLDAKGVTNDDDETDFSADSTS